MAETEKGTAKKAKNTGSGDAAAENRAEQAPVADNAPVEDNDKAPEEEKASRSSGSKGTTYTRDELISGAAAFGTNEAGMAGALDAAGLDSATKADAEQAVKDWNEKPLDAGNEEA